MSDPLLEAALQHHRNGNFREAERLYKEILEKNPRQPDALHLFGVLANEAGTPEIAVQLIREAISIHPAEASYHSNLGNALEKLSRFEEAEASYRQAITLHPKYADAYYNLGVLYYRHTRLQESIETFRRALEINPQIAEAWNNLGVALMDVRQYRQSVLCLQAAIKLAPNYAEAYLNLGNVQQRMGSNNEALLSLQKALSLNPEYPNAWNTLGVVLDNLNQPNAIDCFRKALQCKPEYPEALNNLGKMLAFEGDGANGIALLRQAVSLRPNYVDGHWNLALALLLHGQYPEGWKEHEWRWKLENFPSPKRDFSQPQWQGEDFHGKRLLLHSEQGIGDTLQFARFISLAAQRGTHIIFETSPALRRLLSKVEGVTEVVTYGELLPDFDLHCPLMSLPLALGITVETIPAPLQLPGYASQKEAIASRGEEPLKVGLAWAGNPNRGQDNRRSMTLKALARLAEIPGVSFFSLIKGSATSQIAEVAPHMTVVDLCSSDQDFVDTAAHVAEMDLVISVDTSIAHLAGTLGKRVWILLAQAADWRWLRNREDSPWYPTVRLFRQASFGDWSGVMEQVAQELTRLEQQTRATANEGSFSLSSK